MTQSNATTRTFNETLYEALKDPEQAELYLEDCIKSGNVELAIKSLQDIVEAEKRKFSDRLDALEARVDDFEKRIKDLENIQVTRQEFDDLKARVAELERNHEELKKRIEKPEQARRSVTEVVIRI